MSEHKLDEPIVVEEMSRESKKCCSLSHDIRCFFICCVKSWSLSLNCCEGLCSVLSDTCLCCSKAAIDCNKCLEYIDCDKK